jgi:hypothetical protein
MCSANADVQVNMIEGGVTEWISPAELSELGVRLVAYPMPLLGAAVKAMQARAALQVGTAGVGLRCKWEKARCVERARNDRRASCRRTPVQRCRCCWLPLLTGRGTPAPVRPVGPHETKRMRPVAVRWCAFSSGIVLCVRVRVRVRMHSLRYKT